MTEDEARRVELVRAVEIEDRAAVLLTREDREQADHRARSAAGDLKGRKFERAYIAARADFAAARLVGRHRGLADLLVHDRRVRWAAFVVPLVALVAGAIANEFGTDKRMDLLAVPLLGTIGWNLLVYLWIAAAALARMGKRAGAATNPLPAVLARIGGSGRIDPEQGTAVERAAAVFKSRWGTLSAPVNAARIASALHLAAALFATGLIGGIYLRALVIEYRAGWESTFLGPQAVHAILGTVLGPASQLSGVAIPPLSDIAAMQWSGRETAGVNAAPWIHLYAVTLVSLVIAPRLALSLWQGLRAMRLARTLPVAGRDDFYIRRLLRASGASAGRARVTPYSYQPGEETRRRLTATLQAVLGDGAQVRFDAPIEYGAEEAWAATHALDPDDDYHLLFFTLSSTPEAENHGVLASSLTATGKKGGKGQIVGALIDEGPYRAHFAGQAGLDSRVATRLEGWRTVLAPAGIAPIGIDLSDTRGDELAKRIEANLVPQSELSR